jgi:hypothetical protein
MSVDSVWVAFQFETPDEKIIHRARVSIFSDAADGSLLVRAADAGSRVPAAGIPMFRFSFGEYNALAVADGWVFSWPLTFTISEEDFDEDNPLEDNSADNPLVITFRAVSASNRTGGGLPFVVRGNVPAAPLADEQAGPALGSVRRSAHSHTQVTAWRVTFTHLGDTATPSLRRGQMYQVPVDRNGFFTAALPARSLFSVAMPGRSGVAYILTGEPGQESDVTDLMTASQSVRLDELVRP